MSMHFESGDENTHIASSNGPSDPVSRERIDSVYHQLSETGIVVLDDVVRSDQLQGMRQAFEVQLSNLRWSSVDGYEKTERYRHMVEDVLLLEQAFVDVALHPLVKEVLRRYIGESFSLSEAKGWLSLATKRDFHGWHGDMWFDQNATDDLPREVKLAVYLTDVKSGAFHYIQGSHRQFAPRDWESHEITEAMQSRIMECTGPAGTAILFDTSGIHRQSAPILEPRQAVFLNYHDPAVKIQEESLRSYRYHPLLLNAAFLGGLDNEDCRVLGFGDKTKYKPGHVDVTKHKLFQRMMRISYDATLVASEFSHRVAGKVRRLLDASK